ncbi:DUF2892 domain-containing protein [Corynebacterium breve]|uniref:DUF2892 domain-containing protein n=1 Tax=Corynebacterium breve TaxID=3049799 RepID=A0ABY8VFK6_9CORY|nr:DUF2892 domain-containing protein [Corynebacterium breve]WIM68127.1 DUF2892 domain-containing protein [Corynebacterium breve]
MTPNESGLDRGIRAVIAVAAGISAFTLTEPGKPLGIILIIVAVLMAVTAAIGFCPLYKLLGVSTTK